MNVNTNANTLGFLLKLLLASGAISIAIKQAGPLLSLPETGVSNGAALAIVLSLPLLVGSLLLWRWRQQHNRSPKEQ